MDLNPQGKKKILTFGNLISVTILTINIFFMNLKVKLGPTLDHSKIGIVLIIFKFST